MTRTWLSIPDAPPFAAAGVWQRSDEWGACDAMVMTESAGRAAARVHTRMPVLLAAEDHATWLDGSPDDAFALCKAWPDDLAIDLTPGLWARAAATGAQA